MSDEFKKKMAAEFGFDDLPELEQARIVEKISGMLFESVIERSFEQLGEKGLAEYERILEAERGGYRSVLDVLRQRVPDLEKIAAQEMQRIQAQTASLLT